MRQHAGRSLEWEVLCHRLEQKINPKSDPRIRDGNLVKRLNGDSALPSCLEHNGTVTGVVARHYHDILRRYALDEKSFDLSQGATHLSFELGISMSLEGNLHIPY